MYEHYWGLSSPPFANRLEQQGFYESPVHEEALARMYYAVEQSKALAVIHGPAGCGKSQLMSLVARQIRRTQRFLVTSHLPDLEEAEFLLHVTDQLRLGENESAPAHALWRRLKDFLRTTGEANLQTVLLLDGLEEAEVSTVNAIRRLVRLPYQSEAHLTVITGLDDGRISQPVRDLVEIADLGIEVRPLDRIETETYVRTRLEAAGSERRVFENSVFDQLQSLTGGVPREINRLCDLALLAGMSESRTEIDENLISGLREERGVPVSL